MLDQLVESKSNTAENTRRSEFMIITLVIAVLLVVGLWTRSLFAHDYGMGADDLSLTTLVAPVAVEEEPPPEKPKEQQKQVDADVRKELIANINQSPPKEIPPPSVEKNTKLTIREDRFTVVGNTDSNTGSQVERGGGRVLEGTPGGTGLSTGGDTQAKATGLEDDSGPPPVKKSPPKTVSGGVLNGKATSLPKPAYPAAARAVRAAGSVSVQVLIDENGRVVSASAVSGHPLLRAAAVSAAHGARFSPTLLSGQPVKVSGVITYNFVP